MSFCEAGTDGYTSQEVYCNALVFYASGIKLSRNKTESH